MKFIICIITFVCLVMSGKSQENTYSVSVEGTSYFFTFLYEWSGTQWGVVTVKYTEPQINDLITALVKSKRWGELNKRERLSFSKRILYKSFPDGSDAFMNFTSLSPPKWGVILIAHVVGSEKNGYLRLDEGEEVDKLISDLKGLTKIKDIDKIFN